MFRRRLYVLGALFAAGVLALLARLAQLQIAQGAYYRELVAAMRLAEPRELPFIRGEIQDRLGTTLVRDEPCWEVRVDYPVLAWEAGAGPPPRRITREVSGADEASVEQAARVRLADTWRALAGVAGVIDPEVPYEERLRALHEQAARIVQRVQRIRAAVAARRGFDDTVREEEQGHAVLSGLDAIEQIEAREALAEFPWVHVDAGMCRAMQGDLTPFAHVLGRLGAVDAEDIRTDPSADDPFARYEPDEHLGVSGVEYAAEQRLRGRRGQLVRDREGSVVEEIPAQHGENVRLTIRSDLQQRLYELLAEHVSRAPDAAGGVIVVLDVPTRELLALVSYPAYDPSAWNELYADLRDDTRTQPLRFRAVTSMYPPGSVVKPLVCLKALERGVISLDSRETCTGYLFAGSQSGPRCWEIHGTGVRMAHGSVNVVEALTGSCNVFMYRIGERTGIDALTDAFDMVWIGRPGGTGTGLREEAVGNNPTPGWLAQEKGIAVTPGVVRNLAVGQGELLVTPVMVANLMATYASGRIQGVRVVQSEEAPLVWLPPGSDAHWSAIRRALYQVVNDPKGTAYNHARLEHPLYAICGKTGSATAYPWPTAYEVPYTNSEGVAGVEVVQAGAGKPAIERFVREHPGFTVDVAEVKVAATWPAGPPQDGGERHAHAWFAGYLQRLDERGAPRYAETPRIAFVALVEFGGSGGRAAGPLARDTAAALIEMLGDDLNPDAPRWTAGAP